MKIQLLKDFNKQTMDIIETVYAIEDAYTKEANECITEIEKLIKDKEDIDIHILNYYITQIPIIIFNLVDNIQQLAVKSDAAKMQRKEVFNKSMMDQYTGTIADKTSVAQQACQNEQFIEDVFSRVYKQCERKIDILEMLHGSLKKILQWRVSELEVTRTNILIKNSRGDDFYE